MKNRMRRYLGALVLLLLMAVFVNAGARSCLAASAKVDLTSDKTEVTVGASLTVYIKINSDTSFTSFESNLIYDENILEYKDGSSAITGGSGYLKISDISDAKDTDRKYSLKFKALKTGSCNISFGDDVIIYDESGNELPVSSDNLTITVKAEKTASTNANLKTLETSPVDITPSFDKNTHDYKANVNNETKKLIVSAIPEDEKAKVTVTGNESLKEGKNKVIIKVLAESGDVIEYSINVYREAAPTKEAADHDTAVNSDGIQNTFNIIENNGEQYAAFSGLYKLVEPGSDVVIPDGYEKTEITISDVAVTAFVPVDDTDSEFVLLYAENASGEAGFYQYDKTEKTLQRYAAADKASNTANENVDRSKLDQSAIIIALLITICVFLIIAVIWLSRKQKSHHKGN